MSGLAIAGLTVRFGRTVAVDDVTLAVPTGEVLALVGASGCGKSTLLRAVAGLLVADSGTISWDDVSLDRIPTHQRDVGLMFQDHALFSHRSVEENIGFGLKMAGVESAQRRQRVNELLELVGLDGFGPRSVEGLSGGEAQRVALARALAPEPKMLLLDEPLASLDRARRVELNAELARLLRELNQTAIYVTHDQEEAFALADRIGVMDQGRLLRTGTPAEVWRDPRTELVARFVGHEVIIERAGKRFAVRSDAVTAAPVAPPADETTNQNQARDLNQAVGRNQSAEIVGTVVASTFQGDRHELTIYALEQSWRVFAVEPMAVGAMVELIIDETKLAQLHS